MTESKRAFAVAAHPDDIEFQMAGTLILLKQAGYEIHYLNVANGSCGTATLGREEIIQIRREEAVTAATSIDAHYHESLADDIAIYYEPGILARLSAIMREVAPEILLLQSPQDYMEDHQNAMRLGATAAFTMGMPNFQTQPACDPVDQQVAIYHAQPHGNQNALRQVIEPHIYVDISSVIEQKTEMLACHISQKSWLDQSQGLNAYLDTMQDFAKDVGRMSNRFDYAEGWRKRLHFGYASETFNPLKEALGPYLHHPTVDP
ncbi:MAG: PIG-L family deacetylase [Saprospiraceae bacterium]|nr:PIG-L family deacetylase [Saprospiraceae bacterium]